MELCTLHIDNISRFTRFPVAKQFSRSLISFDGERSDVGLYGLVFRCVTEKITKRMKKGKFVSASYNRGKGCVDFHNWKIDLPYVFFVVFPAIPLRALQLSILIGLMRNFKKKTPKSKF